MKRSPKTSKAAKVLKGKGLTGFKEISENEELKAQLPPGSQIIPGPYGGITIVIPHPAGFSPEVPNFRGPWGQIRKEIFRFEVAVSCGGKFRMPGADRCSDKINAQCDAWITKYYATKNRSELEPPNEIASWLIARAEMASMFAAMEDTHGLRPPDGKVEIVVCDLLVRFWNEEGRYVWHGIHPDASSHSE